MHSYNIKYQVDTSIQKELLNKALEGMSGHIDALSEGEEFMIIDEPLKLSLTFRKNGQNLVLLKVQPSTNGSLL